MKKYNGCIKIIFYFYVKFQKFNEEYIFYNFINQMLLLYSLYKKNYNEIKEISKMGFIPYNYINFIIQ